MGWDSLKHSSEFSFEKKKTPLSKLTIELSLSFSLKPN